MGPFAFGGSFDESNRSYVIFVGSIALVFVLAIILFSVYRNVLTGHASAVLNIDNPVAGKPLSGTLAYDLSGNEILPLDSTVNINFNSYVKSLSLASAISNPSVLDKAEMVTFYPTVHVKVLLTSDASSSASIPISPTITPSAFILSIIGRVITGQPTMPFSGEGDSNNAPPVDEEIPYVPESSSGGSSSAIKKVITEERDYYVRAGSDVSDSIASKMTVASVSSVDVNGVSIGSSEVILKQVGASITLSTQYSQQIRGFSSKVPQIVFDVGKFDLIVPSGTKIANLILTVSSSGTTILQKSQTLTVDDGTVSPVKSKSLDQLVSRTNVPISTSISSSGNSVSHNAPSEDCDRPTCTVFGECSIPSLGQTKKSSAPGSPVKVRECVCPDGSSYTDTQECSNGYDGVDISPYSNVEDDSPGANGPGTGKIRIKNSEGVYQVVQNVWENTYHFDQTSVSFVGGISQGLAEKENIVVPVAGENHEIGVIKLDSTGSVPKVLLQVRSDPFSFYLSLGETRSVDVNKDNIDDMDVTFSSITKGRVVLNVRPYDASSFSNSVSSDEKGITLIKVSTGETVAHVILNNKLPSLRIFLVQSDVNFPAHCYNSIKDSEEIGIDCGGACKSCSVEGKHYEAVIAWVIVLFLFAFLAFLSRKSELDY